MSCLESVMPGNAADEEIGNRRIADTAVEVFVGVFIGEAEVAGSLIVKPWPLPLL